VVAAGGAGAGEDGRAPRVLLFGVDGASWSVLDPMIAEGALPHFAALARDGATADLATVEPVSSPVVWTSIATGRSPEAHRIRDFFATALDRPVPSVFERLAADGRRVGLFDYLMTWPPASLPGGFVIPGWTRRDAAVTPPDVFARAGLAPPYRYSLDGLRQRHEYLASAREELARKAPQWLALARAFDVEVGAVTFYSVDALSHRFWRDVFPGEFRRGGLAPDPAHAGVIREAYAGVDRALGEIRAGLAPGDVLLVASDHGFQADDRGERRIWSSSIEGALREVGLDAQRDAFRVVSQFFSVTIRVLPGPLVERDALAQRLAAALGDLRAPDGTPLYAVDVLDAAPRPPGAERPLLARARQFVVRQAAWWLFGVEFPGDAHAYVLARPDGDALDALWPDGRVRFAGRELPVSQVAAPDDFTGRHHPTAVFLAAGGPIARLGERAKLSVLDLAPLVAHLAGAPIPDDLEGRLPADLLDPAWLAERPPRVVPAASLPAPPRAGAPGATPDDEALRERLRSMGYLR
jgi:hypothetical protein